MKKGYKLIDKLQISDLKDNAVWQYCNIDKVGETAVRPVRRLPVKHLNGRLVGTKVQLANGMFVWVLIGNVDVNNPRLTEHFITISIENRGKWFTLSRYHDFDYNIKGPCALAKFLGLEIDQIFPISYDISQYVMGNPSSLIGQILKGPREKLTRAEIIAMAVP